MKETSDYLAKKISTSIFVDGDINKKVWQEAQWSNRFVDMVSGEPGIYNTQSAIVWNETHLYIAFKIEEPFIEAHMSERDSIIFLENDVEVFIDGGDCYYEFEINALNTIYEVFFIWKDSYRKNGKFDIPDFDVHKPEAYTFGGDYDRSGSSFWKGTNPRGIRWAFTDFDIKGLHSAVKIDGTLNDNSDIDIGWSVELSIPWESLQLLSSGRSLPPSNGDIWKMFLGRFQKMMLNGIEVQPHPAMALNCHNVYDTHLPEKWSRIKFIY